MTVDQPSRWCREFAASRPFTLDRYQHKAIGALDAGASVLVCAPTGAGKTVVGEFAVASALRTGRRCFYTTPLKALSNQKFRDLGAEFGAEQVGLLTGDQSVNAHAPVVVMTTEVLRNMLYAGSDGLDGLQSVVLDEVHFLADRFRGAVWEEVILHLPPSIRIVGLSATVSNAEEFGSWIRQVRGETAVIVDEVRPVPLWQHMFVGGRLYDLFESRSGGLPEVRISPSLRQAVQREQRAGMGYSRDGRARPQRPARRSDVVVRLEAAGLLPAIGFIFSRAGCDAAVAQCMRVGLVLTSDAEQAEITAVIRARTAALPREDLEVLGYREWRAALRAGFAAHHAGLLPVFKEVVEELFQRGLAKMVFATETLALGINMPARSVYIERLIKYNGEAHVTVTAGEYTQLTGRAGRRGIDIEGHAIVAWSPEVEPESVAGLASTRTFPLRSSFRPTYNMAVNLLSQWGRQSARELLERSFAQFQADRGVAGLVRQRAAQDRAAEEAVRSLTCDRGDVDSYLALLADLSQAERAAKRARTARRTQSRAADLGALRRGDVVHIPYGRRSGLAVVLDPGRRADGTGRPLVCTDRRWAGRIDPSDFGGTVPVLGRLRLAKFVEHRHPTVRRDLASALAGLGIRHPEQASAPSGGDEAGGDARSLVAQLRGEIRSHPVHLCPDRDEHVRRGRRYARLHQEAAALAARIDRSQRSLGAELDRLVNLLVEQGYLADDKPTDRGRVLRRLWSDADLVMAECLWRGLWSDLDAPGLAGVVSTLVFESRADRPGAGARLAGHLSDAIAAVAEVREEIALQERRHGLPETRQLDIGFAAAIATWTGGSTLAEALQAAAVGGVDLAPGDFVRWARQVVDVLDQIRNAAPTDLAPRAGAAVAAIRTGIVAMGADGR